MSIKEIFEKQGGRTLIRQYWKSGALFTAANQFIVLGHSKTALEILSLSASLKTKKKLEKKYIKVLDEFEKEYKDDKLHNACNKVWICWFQGIENAPEIVKRCVRSVTEMLSDREVIVITYDNMYDYISFPALIQNKIDKGIIKGAHLSDLIRLELLTNYGGTWIDATVLCTREDIPPYMLDSDLFLFQLLKPGKFGHTCAISNWFITARANNKLILAMRHLMFAYWRDYDELIDYYIFHDLFQIVIEKYPEEWAKVVPYPNSSPHILLLRLFDPFDSDLFEFVLAQSPFHKLTYKFTEKQASIEGTNYKYIINEYGE